MSSVQWGDLCRKSQRCHKSEEGRENQKQGKCNAAYDEIVLSGLDNASK